MKNWCKGNSHAGKNGGRKKKSFDIARSEMPRVREARNLLHKFDDEIEHVLLDVDVTESENKSDEKSVSA